MKHNFKLLALLLVTSVNQLVADTTIEEIFSNQMLTEKQPSQIIRNLQKQGILGNNFPELAALIFTQQRPDYHPEGTAFEHTMQALDIMAQLIREGNFDDNDKLILLWAALFHDLGKAQTTEWSSKDGKPPTWHSPGHAEAGARIAQKALNRINAREFLKNTVPKLIHHHMAARELKGKDKIAYEILANELKPATVKLLLNLTHADRGGRVAGLGEAIPPTDKPVAVQEFEKELRKAGVLKN